MIFPNNYQDAGQDEQRDYLDYASRMPPLIGMGISC